MTEPREPADNDPVVQDALGRLPIPDHGPTFWAELDRRLDAVDYGTGDVGSEPPRAERVVVPMVSVPPEAPPQDVRIATGELPAIAVLRDRPERPRHALAWLSAAAVVLVAAVGVAIVSLQNGGEPGTSDQAGGPTETTSIPFLSNDTAPSVPDAATSLPARAEASRIVVDEFVVALGSDDFVKAASLVGPETREYLEAFNPGRPLETVLAEFGEGLPAGFADSPDREYDVDELGPGPAGVGDVGVVTLTGTWMGEGERERASLAFAVVNRGDGWLVEFQGFNPGEDNNAAIFTSPPTGEDGLLPLPPDGAIEVFFGNPGTVYFLIDGEVAHSIGTTPVGDNPEPYAQMLLRNAYAPGEHQLVLVFVSDQAVFAEGPIDIEVAEPDE